MKNTSKIRVAHVMANLETGGMENGIVNLCNGLDKEEFEVLICCLRGRGAMENRLSNHIRVKDMGFPKGKVWSGPLRLAHFFKKNRPDIVHTHGWGAGSFSGILGARIAGIPVVINGEHGTIFKRKKYHVPTQKFLSNLVQSNLCVSHGLRQRISQELGISLSKIKVIPNGVDVRRFSPIYAQESLRQQFGFSSDDFLIGSIGSIKKIKRQDLMIKVLSILINQGLDAQLLLIGEGPLVSAIKNQAKSLGIGNKVHFLGRRDDIPQLLNLMNIFILTSEYEGMSNVLMEAMACALPVIIMDSVDKQRELVKHGENGLVVPFGDIRTMAHSIMRLKSDEELSKKLGMAAREYINCNYSLKKMIDTYQRLYISLLH